MKDTSQSDQKPTITADLTASTAEKAAEKTARRRGRPRRKPVPVAEELLPLTLGMILRQARQKQRIKLQTVAKRLRIREGYLDALEEGHYYKFPALVYGIGFLRTYATFLGLDADELVTRFRRETMGIRAEPINMPYRSDSGRIPSVRTVVRSLLVLLVVYVAWNVLKIVMYEPLPQPMPTVVSEPEADLPTVSETAPEMIRPIVTEAVKTAVPHAVAVSKRTPKIYGLQKAARVSFVATDRTRIEVRDTEADSVLLNRELEAGDRYNPVEDPDGLVLKTTNAGGLDVYVDGKKVRTLGKKGQTKAGLQMDADNLLKE